MCPIVAESELAELIRMTKLIYGTRLPWSIDVVLWHDRTMRDICRTDPSTPSEQVFGGKIVVFGGDF
uniref:ATP-dependent DNA helicase n=1 Tax=Tanacetum cinerariifolium TaxID=118510 RepID=A0A699TWC0_TANCI|nr:ATP-dependent DNA helicase PIF4-like [Tanacetum cinerariifolium]